MIGKRYHVSVRKGKNMIRCANCGNDNPRIMHDEGDLVFCNICKHHTVKATGEDDLIRCPFCKRMRDRTSSVCMWCKLSGDVEPKPTEEEIREYEKDAEEFIKGLTPSNVKFWKIRNL